MAHPQKGASLHTSGMNTMPGWIRASFSCSKHLQGRVPIENHSGLAAWKRWGNVRRQTLSKKHGLPLPWVGPPRIHFTPSAAYKGAVDNCEWLILPFLVFNLLSVRAPPSPSKINQRLPTRRSQPSSVFLLSFFSFAFKFFLTGGKPEPTHSALAPTNPTLRPRLLDGFVGS